MKQSEKMEQVLSYSLQLDSMGKPELVELLKKLRGNLKSKFVFVATLGADGVPVHTLQGRPP